MEGWKTGRMSDWEKWRLGEMATGRICDWANLRLGDFEKR